MIPRRTIRTTWTQHMHSAEIRRCEASLLQAMPHWEHLLFDGFAQRDFVEEHRPELLLVYDAFPRNIQRSDLFRLIAVSHLGGFYLDTDVMLFHPLDELCTESLVWPFEHRLLREKYLLRYDAPPAEDGQLCQWGNYGFGAEAGHWFIEEVIAEIVRRAPDFLSTMHPVDVLWSTGPDCVNAVRDHHHARLENEVCVLRSVPRPEEIAAAGCELQGPPDYFHFGRYGTHLMAGSWWRGW
jgi:mannosyltransferase OCH1-like enzyme